ncbi:LOW QUALITY PROTEIN: hypothetical protein IFM46972_09769 [Aspergillus udagawae]|uniref:Uncharacterized protein n=1 Tax=Aspergillus udagawae TaxID=91492 RepID=A0A8H3S8Q4_9EURO|nr:LOW QUALITY PROTEIN: hypothetical protein IFM46972_09769 [Aspergillus udagawae]
MRRAGYASGFGASERIAGPPIYQRLVYAHWYIERGGETDETRTKGASQLRFGKTRAQICKGWAPVNLYVPSMTTMSIQATIIWTSAGSEVLHQKLARLNQLLRHIAKRSMA